MRSYFRELRWATYLRSFTFINGLMVLFTLTNDLKLLHQPQHPRCDRNQHPILT
jgi:hypothetical protein